MIDYKDITIMWKDTESAHLVLGKFNEVLSFEKYINRTPQQPFMGGEVDRNRIQTFLTSRCVPANRANIKEILTAWGIESYNPWEIVKVTHGRMAQDYLWLRFGGEDITWDDLKLE